MPNKTLFTLLWKKQPETVSNTREVRDRNARAFRKRADLCDDALSVGAFS